MGFWTFWAVAVVCGCVMEVYRIYAKSKSRTSDKDVERLEARLAHLENAESLEDRIRTLEAIITDPKYQLAKEISSLKNDSQAPPTSTT